MGFHIIFATLGVGLPLMILMAELIYQKQKIRIMPLWQNGGRRRRLFCSAWRYRPERSRVHSLPFCGPDSWKSSAG
ncbi:hypothetical protein QNN00_09590 [Bacillus velezensis]|nr:hypothetical protein [Bacillus velezensis]